MLHVRGPRTKLVGLEKRATRPGQQRKQGVKGGTPVRHPDRGPALKITAE